MARKRIIDPSIWTDPDFSSLTVRQRLLYIGLISNADDYGRMHAHPSILRVRIFPYDDLSLSEVSEDLKAVEDSGLIRCWENAGERYLFHPKWFKYQRFNHPGKTNIPPPPDHLVEEDFLRPTMPEPEKRLWERLQGRESGWECSRQYRILGWIVDFYFASHHLVIEVDGPEHNKRRKREADRHRDEEMGRHGLTVVRYTNQQVMEDIEEVLLNIQGALTREGAHHG